MAADLRRHCSAVAAQRLTLYRNAFAEASSLSPEEDGREEAQRWARVAASEATFSRHVAAAAAELHLVRQAHPEEDVAYLDEALRSLAGVTFPAEGEPAECLDVDAAPPALATQSVRLHIDEARYVLEMAQENRMPDPFPRFVREGHRGLLPTNMADVPELRGGGPKPPLLAERVHSPYDFTAPTPVHPLLLRTNSRGGDACSSSGGGAAHASRSSRGGAAHASSSRSSRGGASASSSSSSLVSSPSSTPPCRTRQTQRNDTWVDYGSFDDDDDDGDSFYGEDDAADEDYVEAKRRRKRK